MDCPYAFNTHPELGPKCLDPEACTQGATCETVRNTEYNQRRKTVNAEQQPMADVLSDWWFENAKQAVELIAPKAVEYSAVDLIEYGKTLALVMDIGHPISDEEATEIGIWGYLVGKVARWTGAIKEGRRVSDDTIFDIKVYATMAERTRAVGGWPFGKDNE